MQADHSSKISFSENSSARRTVNTEISAVICTRNQAMYLEKSLASLTSQTLAPEKFQIIIVDNGSTDHTKEIVKEYVSLKNILYIYDPVVGLSRARNTGWKNASGKYVAFLDDDAIATPNWLEGIIVKFGCIIPKPVSVGGKILPIWEAERPEWLVKEMETHIGIIDWSEKPMFLANDKLYLAGSNISYNRKVLEESGGFDTRLGRKGVNLLSNEEIMMQRYLRRRNLPIWYDPAICVHHHIRPERLRKQWFYRRYYYQGASDAILIYQLSAFDGLQWKGLREVQRDKNRLVSAFKKYNTSRRSETTNWVIQRCGICYWVGRLFADTRIAAGRL